VKLKKFSHLGMNFSLSSNLEDVSNNSELAKYNYSCSVTHLLGMLCCKRLTPWSNNQHCFVVKGITCKLLKAGKSGDQSVFGWKLATQLYWVTAMTLRDKLLADIAISNKSLLSLH